MVAVRAAHTSHHEPCCSQSNARTLPVDLSLLPATRARGWRSVQSHVCAVAHESACAPDEAAVNALSLADCSATLPCGTVPVLTTRAVAAQQRGRRHSWQHCICRSIVTAAASELASPCLQALHQLL